ncbi:uncharacterized protein LOC120442070 [Oreochromis aureus]|uniref:uncharacterized protein LOC120442070 n=1 Tax=Oreochromis aureus TaxID=47969 RepID=UPI001954FB7D|nr:uncharacterized protein LOC120442070 [Oreochromis aureus]
MKPKAAFTCIKGSRVFSLDYFLPSFWCDTAVDAGLLVKLLRRSGRVIATAVVRRRVSASAVQYSASKFWGFDCCRVLSGTNRLLCCCLVLPCFILCSDLLAVQFCSCCLSRLAPGGFGSHAKPLLDYRFTPAFAAGRAILSCILGWGYKTGTASPFSLSCGELRETEWGYGQSEPAPAVGWLTEYNELRIYQRPWDLRWRVVFHTSFVVQHQVNRL